MCQTYTSQDRRHMILTVIMIRGVRVLISKLYYPASESYQELAYYREPNWHLINQVFQRKPALSSSALKVYIQIVSSACERNRVLTT